MAKTGKAGATGKKSDPWMLEEDYFLQKNIHQKGRKRRLNYSGKVEIHYSRSPKGKMP